MTESRVLAEIERDAAMHRESGGGVTFSGGEPLLQADFLVRLLDLCRARGIHAAVDTCGAAPAEAVDRVADRADLFLFDLKHMDDEAHRRMTGSSNRDVLDNLRGLARRAAAVRVRVPVIPGVNDDAGHLGRLAAFVLELGWPEVDVVPYRRPAAGTYEALGRPDPSARLAEPGPDAVAAVCRLLSAHGVRASVVERRLARR
jgi:pyruvate formate lyase activating enzyme